MATEVTVRNNSVSRTYDAFVDDQIVGSIIYEQTGTRIVLSHTIVEPEFRGQGVATKLVRFALDDIRARKMTMTNYCGFVAEFLEAHPDYVDLVDSAHPGHVRH